MNIKYYLKVISFFLIILFVACTFNEPLLPNWETIWEFPIPDISFKMSEAIDNEYVFADTTQQGIPILCLSIKDTVEKKGILNKNLSINPYPIVLAATLNNINLSSPGRKSTEAVAINDVLGFGVQTGDSVIIPSNTNLNLPSQYVLFSNFQYAFVNTGKLVLEYNNQTFLEIDDGMQIEIYDDSTGQFIGTSTFAAIGPYSSQVANDSLDISGKLISHRLRLESQVPLMPISHFVTNQDTSGFSQTDVYISNLVVEEAIANIGEQTARSSGARSVLQNDNHVNQAVIDKGQIYLYFQNQLQSEATVVVTLPNFEKQQGIPFTKTQLIPALSIDSSSIDLKDLHMYNFKNPGLTIDSLHYEMDIITTPSSGLIYTSNRDSVIVRIDSDSIFFQEFSGELATVTLQIDTTKKEDIFEYGGFAGGIKLDNAQITINIYNEIGIPVDMIVNVIGEHRNSETGQIENSLELDPIPISVIPGITGSPSINPVILNNSNSKISELLAILPTDILMFGSATIMGEGTLTIFDSVWADYEITSPFNILVDSIPDFNSHMEKFDKIDSDIKEAIKNQFQYANLEFNYENGLPLDVHVNLIFAKDTTDFFELDTADTNKLIIDDFNINSGTIGSNGFVNSSYSGQLFANLNEKQVKILSADTLYFGTKFQFPGVNKEIKFSSTDEFIAIGALKFKVYMNPQE
jgi:hypothetical protein